MNKINKIVSIITLAVFFSTSTTCFARDDSTKTTEIPILGGPYLGQESPGMQAKPFAPDIIPVDGIQHCFPTISPDGREVYWMTFPEGGKPTIMFTKEVEGRWTPPRAASFSGEYGDHAPFFSHDGQRIYFASSRPGGYGKGDIWYVERNDKGWSKPINLGSPPNSEESESQPTLTKDGTIYFISALKGVQWGRGIYRSPLSNGHYLKREALDSIINTKYADIYPFIAPDESYLLFGSSRPGARSVETDLYISFRNDEYSWGKPRQLGDEINNGSSVSFSCVTSDGKYLLFNRFINESGENGTDAFFWIGSKILDKYKLDKEEKR